MVIEQKPSAADFLPNRRTLANLRAAARRCKGCDLYKKAPQTVFGEGSKTAKIILVGEQPGDIEDRQGRPFVGPAGRLLDKALAEARIARGEVDVTNVVKHFKWIQRGKRRLHQKPTVGQVISCRPWLQEELEIVRPKLVVCLGATAAQALLGRAVRVTAERGKFFQSDAGWPVFVTIHPSSIYRHRDRNRQQQEYRQFVTDIQLMKSRLSYPPA